MVDEIVCIPLNDPMFRVRVIALYKGREPGPFAYLQGMRTGSLKAVKSDPEETEVACLYHRKERTYFAMLATAIPGPVDAILSPPSGMTWQAEPYRRAIADVYPKAVDLTDAVSRTGEARAGKGASIKEVVAHLLYKSSGREKEFRRLVIVDDTFTTGTTTAAIVSLLASHGLSKACEVIVACPLWLNTSQ